MPTDTHMFPLDLETFFSSSSSSSSSSSLSQTHNTIWISLRLPCLVYYGIITTHTLIQTDEEEVEEEECYSPFESIHHTCSCSRKTVPPLPAKEREREISFFVLCYWLATTIVFLHSFLTETSNPTTPLSRHTHTHSRRYSQNLPSLLETIILFCCFLHVKEKIKEHFSRRRRNESNRLVIPLSSTPVGWCATKQQ